MQKITYWPTKSINKGKYFVRHTLGEQKFSIHTLLNLETALPRVFLTDITSTPYCHLPITRSCCRCQFQMKLGNLINGAVKHSECIMHTLGAISGKNTAKLVRSWSQNTRAQFENNIFILITFNISVVKTTTPVLTSHFYDLAHSALVRFMTYTKVRNHFFNTQTKTSTLPWRAHAINPKAGYEMHNRE